MHAIVRKISELTGDPPFEVFSLDDTSKLDKVVSQHSVVLHVAGVIYILTTTFILNQTKSSY